MTHIWVTTEERERIADLAHFYADEPECYTSEVRLLLGEARAERLLAGTCQLRLTIGRVVVDLCGVKKP